MGSFIAEDHAAASYAFELKQRLDALEQSGMGKDDQGNVVTVSADQVVTSGTEIGGITIGSNRTAFYAPAVQIPEASKVTVTPLTDSGTKIANIKVDDTLYSVYAPTGEQVTVTPALNNGTAIGTIQVGNTSTTLYAPEIVDDGQGGTVDISGKLDAPSTAGTNGQVLATNGQGTTYWTDNGSGGGSTVTVTQNVTSGTKIATVTVDGTATSIYAPTSSGGGNVVAGDAPLPLLCDLMLNEDVSSIIISQDDEGNALNITEAFYIVADFELAETDRARYFTAYVGETGNATDTPIFSIMNISTTRGTYADVYAKQIAQSQWLVEARTKTTMYEAANGVGTSLGELAYSNWNGFNNPPSTVNRITIGYDTGNYGTNTRIRLYGR